MNHIKHKKIKILAIESSCDDTSAAIVEVNRGYRKLIKVNKSYQKSQPILTSINQPQPLLTIISNIISSQIKLHSKYGGVYPELASREHLKNILPVIEQALGHKIVRHEALRLMADIDYLAVTTGPGLIGSLLVGTNTAKTLSYIFNKLIYPINHLEGHIYANFVSANPKSQYLNSKRVSKTINHKPLPLTPIQFPLITLVVSGGHTSLVYMKNHLDYKIIGETLDDAAGEAFDKLAKMLDLGYPGGPIISKLAEKVNKGYKNTGVTNINRHQPTLTDINQISFPRPMINSNDFNFSFSGLKTSALYTIQKLPKPLASNLKRLICHEFQNAIVETLVSKTIVAAKKYQAKSILLSGGVAANDLLRKTLRLEADDLGLRFFVPEKSLCTDNAAMIATAAAYKIALGIKPTPWYNVNASSNIEL